MQDSRCAARFLPAWLVPVVGVHLKLLDGDLAVRAAAGDTDPDRAPADPAQAAGAEAGARDPPVASQAGGHYTTADELLKAGSPPEAQSLFITSPSPRPCAPLPGGEGIGAYALAWAAKGGAACPCRFGFTQGRLCPGIRLELMSSRATDRGPQGIGRRPFTPTRDVGAIHEPPLRDYGWRS